MSAESGTRSLLASLRSSFIVHRSSFQSLSPRLKAAVVFYILHILLQGKIALSELMAFWSIFFVVWAMIREGVRPAFHILYSPLALYGLVSTVSALAAPVRIHAFGEGMLWFKMLIFPTAYILYRALPWLRSVAVGAYVILAVGIATWGLIEFVFFDRRDLEHRINGPSAHVMTFSGLLLPLSLLLFLWWWYERRAWQLAGAGIVTTALLLTFTRSVWFGWVAAFVTLVVLTRSRIRVYAYAVPAMLFFVVFMPLDLFSRLISTFDMKQESNFDRIRMVEAGVEMIKDFPLLGVGPANVKEIYALYRKPDAPRPRPPHLHNNVVHLWAERGILGLFSYLLLLALFLRSCAQAWGVGVGRRGQGAGGRRDDDDAARTCGHPSCPLPPAPCALKQRMWGEIGVAIAVSLTVAGLFEFNFGDTEVFYLMLNLFALVLAWLADGAVEPNEPAPALVPAAA